MSEVRYSVRRASDAASPRDLATALIASRRLAGKPMTQKDAEQIIRNLGQSGNAADILAAATILADSSRGEFCDMVERSDPELVAALARKSMCARTLAEHSASVGSSWSGFVDTLKMVGYLLAIGIGLFVGYWVLVSPYYLFEWMWGEDYWDWDNHRTWSVVFAILFWIIPILAIIFRRHLGRFALASIRAVRRGFRRIEEATRPEVDSRLSPAHALADAMPRESPATSTPCPRESKSKKCLAADIDDLHTYCKGVCGLKCDGEWAEFDPNWKEGCDFTCDYDGRWTQCPHYCGSRA